MARGYRYEHVVTLDETNAVGNVYFAHYLHWQGHCRERFLADHAPGVLTALREGTLALVTVSCSMEFYQECFGLDRITVLMTLDGRAGSRVGMSFVFLRDGAEVARGRQEIACLRRTPEGLHAVALPADFAVALADFAG